MADRVVVKFEVLRTFLDEPKSEIIRTFIYENDAKDFCKRMNKFVVRAKFQHDCVFSWRDTVSKTLRIEKG